MKTSRKILKKIRKDILIDLIIEEEKELESVYKELAKAEYLLDAYRHRLTYKSKGEFETL